MRSRKGSKIPEFESIQEEAGFWDTHDTTEFLEEFEEADEVIFIRPEKQVVSLRLERDFVDRLKAYAQEVGVPYTTLIRMWIIKSFKREVESERR
ncbi:MAG: CopG family antitoxin [Candidatus Bipolaricaulia bacterium]